MASQQNNTLRSTSLMQKKMVMEKLSNKNTLDIQKTKCKLEDVNLNLSVKILHVNRLNNPIKKQMGRINRKI